MKDKLNMIKIRMPALRPAFCVLFLCLFSYGFSQNLDTKISLKADNKPLGEVLDLVALKGKVKLSYSSQSIPVKQLVSLNAVSKSVNDVLTELLSPYQIVILQVEDQIVLKKKSGEISSNERQRDASSTISGFIRDLKTGEYLIGASIYAKGTAYGAVSNTYGFFSLTLPQGDYTFVASYIGYESIVQQINLSGNIVFKIDLDPVKLTMDEVVITDDNHQATAHSDQLSGMKFTPNALDRMPGFVGDVDIVKSLDIVPGINSFGDGSSQYYVRGGSADQNYLIIDEAPVYNPSHLFGFFTSFAPDAIKEVEAFKGDFPAKYGGRLSSVIDVKSKDGNMKRFGFSGNLGPYVSSLTIEGPIIQDISSFFISARKSNLNWLSDKNNATKSFSLDFFDLNAKFNLRINPNNRLFLSLYGGSDEFTRTSASAYRTFGISWNNALGSLRWNHIFGPKLFSNTTLYASRYNYFLYIDKSLNDYWTSAVSTLALKSDFTWFINNKNTLRSGFEVARFYSNPGNIYFEDTLAVQDVPEVPDYYSKSFAFYLSNQQQLGSKLVVRYGFRLNLWKNTGPGKVYYYDTNHKVIGVEEFAKGEDYFTHFSPEPRATVLYSINALNELKLSYSRTTQYLQILSNSVSPFTSMEVWAPAGPNIKPQYADQVAVGYSKQLKWMDLAFSAEAFYKKFNNQIDFEEHPDMLYNPYLEGELRFGKAWSYGAEFLLRKSTGKLNGWIGYTYTRAKRKIEGVNNNQTYSAYYDRPHDFSFNLSYKTPKHWVFAATWIYVTGGAITTPTGFYTYNGYTVPVYGSKNNSRLPDYHRLDLALTYHFNPDKWKYKHSVMLSVFNAYGRKNPFSLNYNKIMNDNGDFVVPTDMEGGYEIIPTTVSVAGVIPSINYIFRF